ncbi:MAG: hypothetical protein K0S64_1308, partial [Gaiellaceae bacterium]|nr:hypothetical protein [Gaiellaceae bacterium]
MAALDDAVEGDGHVVAQVVEAELRVRPVRDVAAVCLAPLCEGHEVLDVADRAPEQLVDRLRPLRVALHEVVVDGDEMNAASGETVQIERLDCNERLAFSRLHLGDVALVEDDAAHQLDIEETDADRPLERLANGGIRLEDQVLERLPVLDALLELGSLRAQLVVGELLELGLERPDVGGLFGEPLDAAPLAHAEDALELPERGRGHGPRVPARLGDRAVPGGYRIVTNRSPNGGSGAASVDARGGRRTS